ncbi:MAG: hypothetical protein OHK0013_21190 [Sandaracinaceae bacterium]
MRRLFADILAKDARAAAESGDGRWSVTLFPRAITMNVGAIYTASCKQSRGTIGLVVELDQIDATTRAKLDALGMVVTDYIFATQDRTRNIKLPIDTVRAAWPLVEAAHLASVRRAARGRTRYARSHSPGVVRWIEETTGLSLSGTPSSSSAPSEPGSVLDILRRALTGYGLSYDDDTLAAFYTALQVKGFVILGGISGTGKTKLVQALAKALGQRTTVTADADVEQPVVFMKPYMRKYARMVLPRRIAELFDPPPVNTSVDVPVILDETRTSCRLGHRLHGNATVVWLSFKGDGRAWLNEKYREGRPRPGGGAKAQGATSRSSGRWPVRARSRPHRRGGDPCRMMRISI